MFKRLIGIDDPIYDLDVRVDDGSKCGLCRYYLRPARHGQNFSEKDEKMCRITLSKLQMCWTRLAVYIYIRPA